MTCCAFSTEGRELFRESGDSESVEIRSAEGSEELSMLCFVEEDTRASLCIVGSRQLKQEQRGAETRVCEPCKCTVESRERA